VARGPEPASKRPRPFGNTIAEAFPAILINVKSGMPIVHACELAGFSKSSVLEWIRTTAGAREEMDKAKADRDERLVRSLYAKAQDDPQLAKYWLERRRPDEWAQNSRIEVTGKDGGPIATTTQTRTEALQELTDMARTSPEVRAALIQIIRETDPDGDASR
jgi:hypothetical protein